MTAPNPAQALRGEVSVTGIAVRLPGADEVEAFWRQTVEGVTTFTPVSRTESELYGYTAAQIDDEAFVPMRSALGDIDAFDADAFGISARDAALMDPQHRVFLECARGALDDAGLDDVRGRAIGVFGSSSSSTYLTGPVRAAGLWDETDINFSAMLANEKDFLCTRVSYALGLTGPSIVVQSACSSSLLAVHLARQALLRGECDAAVVGGVSISLPHLGGYLVRSGSIFSPTGACRPFDATADGTVKAHGAAVVVLVRSEDADPAREYARVSGTAANNDGDDKAGFPAPGIAGQAAVIRSALAAADAAADDVRYVETHGTGTLLGDPIEVRALRLALQGATAPCYLGSAKANVGHLDAAAGVTGLIRAALVLERGVIPPLAGFSQESPLLGHGEDLVLPTASIDAPWLTHAGVSSFGMGGTNVHAVLHRRNDARRRPAPSGGRRLARTRHWVADIGHAEVVTTRSIAGPPTTTTAGPRSLATSDELLMTVRKILRLPLLMAEDNLVDAGADSLALIDIVATLGDRFGIALDVVDLERIGTVGELARLHARAVPLDAPVRGAAPPVDHGIGGLARIPRSAIRITPVRKRTVFLVHPAGGTTTCYAGLAPHVGNDVGIVGLGFPVDSLGLGITMRELARSYMTSVLETQPAGPYVIGGYSFGGNLAAEMALQLEAAGHTVELLVLFDAHPPHAYTSGSCDERAYVDAFPALLGAMLPDVRFGPDPRGRSDARAVLDAVVHPVWPPSVRDELARFYEVWRENHGMLKRWTPDRSIECPVLIVEASEPEPAEVLERLAIAPTTVQEWSRYLTEVPEIVGVRGDHYSIFRDRDALRAIGEIVRFAMSERAEIR